ncbi:MAG TPA: pitrilysin family protein, partial [Longimicrobiales bacterium]|nr:pitrilysin family protein [Longimicrobiales bacterium]
MRPTPSIGAPARLPEIELHSFALGNRMPVHVIERRDLPIVDVDIVFQPGAVVDHGATAGRVDMMCELLDEGTRSRTAFEIAEQIDHLGAYLDVHATHDAITISCHVQSAHLEKALAVVSDVLLDPLFEAAEFKRKKDEHIRALRQDRDEADIVASKALAAGVFGAEHPYGSPLGGTVATLENLGVDEVRAVYDSNMTARNGFVVAVGDIRGAELAAVLERGIGSLKGGSELIAPVMPPAPENRRRVILVDKPGAAQAELRVGHVAPDRGTADYFPMVVLNAILGGSFTSRLNTILREQMGVTYGASSRFRLRKHGGIFSAGAAVFTEAAARSAQVVVEEMTRVIDSGVKADEMQRAQNYIALGLPRSFETTQELGAHIREQIVHSLPPDYWAHYVDRVLSVTAVDVAEVAARRLLPEECTIVVAADANEVSDALEKANLGEVVITDVAP